METVKIIICEECNGYGEILKRSSSYDSKRVVCSKCNGYGRFKEVTTVVLETMS